MEKTNLGVALTLKIGEVAFTVEVKKDEFNKPSLKIEAKNNAGYIECKK